jgi:hypothetical protein
MRAETARLLERIGRLMGPLSWALAVAGVLTGLILLATCAATAGVTGALAGIGSLIVIVVFMIFFVGSVYYLTTTHDDVRAIRRNLEDQPSAAAERGEEHRPSGEHTHG